MAPVDDKVEFVGVFAGADEHSGEQTPAGFQDTPGQWYSAIQRKRGAASAPVEDDGEATLRDSQETQDAAVAATEPVSQTEGEAKAPVFVYASGSLSDENSGDGGYRHHQQRREEEEIDEDETQIIMSLSQDRYGLHTATTSRKIEEEELVVSRAAGDAVLHSASDDEGADSDMSDDMLAHDGPIEDISTLAASFQQKDADAAEQSKKKKAPVNVYRPRTQFRQTPTHSVEEDSSSSSGTETEVEGEPEGDLEEQQEPSTIVMKANLRGLAHPTPRFARQRSMSEHSTASEKEDGAGRKDEHKNRPKRFRLDSLSRSRRLERHDSTASDMTNNDEEISVHTTAKTAVKQTTGAKKPARSSPVKSKKGVAVATEKHAPSRSKKLLQDEGAKDSGSQSSIASPTEVVATTMQESKIGGEGESERSHGLPPKSTVKGKTPRKNPSTLAIPPAAASRKRRLGSGSGESSEDSEATQVQEKQIRVILTGLEPTPAIRKKIKAIGSVYEDDIEKATHVIAPKNQLKRTVKLLCGISRCDHILDEKWLDESAKAGAPLQEQDYCLLDTRAQEKWHFDLHKTMYEFTPEQRRQLFVGHTVFITNHKSVLPPVKDLVKIVECAGGKAEVKGSAGPSDLVITSETALSVLSVRKSLASANPQRIYSPELILSSILQQHIEFNKNHLELPSSSSGSSRKRR